MELAVGKVINKSHRGRKRFPRVGEMVRMTARNGLFLVTRTDRQLHVADLVHRVRDQVELKENVPFQFIHTVPNETSRLIKDFLHS